PVKKRKIQSDQSTDIQTFINEKFSSRATREFLFSHLNFFPDSWNPDRVRNFRNLNAANTAIFTDIDSVHLKIVDFLDAYSTAILTRVSTICRRRFCKEYEEFEVVIKSIDPKY